MTSVFVFFPRRQVCSKYSRGAKVYAFRGGYDWDVVAVSVPRELCAVEVPLEC